MIKNNESDFLIAKILDKKHLCDKKNRITYSDFLNEKEQREILKKQNFSNCFFYGGSDNSDRKIAFFYPEKIDEEIAKKMVASILTVIRISLPNDCKGKYEHRDYLSAIIKIGIERSKIGDIITDQNGADIVIFEANKKYIIQGLSALTRFRKSKIINIAINEIRKREEKFEEKNIIVSSMRCDNIVSELGGCSRSKACELIENEKVLINYETVLKSSKNIEIKDTVTIRGKGKFIIDSFVGNTRKDRMIILVKKYI